MDLLGAAANLATQPLRAYLSSLLREQLKQYLDDGAQLEALGVFGGEIVLQKVELRLDALKKLVPVPPGFAITRGFVRELRIIIPWTALFSQAISIRLDTVECVLETSSKDTNASNSSFSLSTASVAPNGGGVTDSASSTNNDGGGGLPEWLQSRVTKVLSNITLSVSNLVFRYVHESIAVVMGLRSLDVVSADPHAAWAPAFVDPEGVQKISYKVLSIKDLTITMDDNPVNIALKQEKNVNHLDPVDEIIQRSYIEEPILSRTNIILRARVMLEPNATDPVKDGGSDENNSSFDGNSSSENKQAISILSTSSSSSSSSSTTVSGYEQPSFESLLCAGLGCPGSLNDKRRSREVLDPFSTDVLTSFPGEINQVVVDRNNIVVAPLTTMATLLHVFVDSLELGLSARQAALLERLTQRLEGIDENKQADSKSLSQNGNNNEDIHYVKSSSGKKLKKVEEKEEMATTTTSTSDSKNEESQGLIGWLWGSLTGTTDEEIIQAPIETSLHLLDKSNQQGSPSRNSNRGGGGEEAAAGRGGGAGVGGHYVIVRPRVILANAHVGRISLVLYRHEAKKKLREEDVPSSSIPASPGATSASYLLSSKDAVKSLSSSLRVPVANKGFVSIDTLFNQSTAPNSPGINTFPWKSGGSNRTQQHVPVPFLRITCDSSWAQVRVLEEPCLDPLRNNANSPSTMVVDGYLDIGSLQASPWDLSLEERFVNSRSRQRSRQARVFDIFGASTASNPAKDDASVTRESIRLVSSLESVKSVTIAAPHTPAKSINSNNSVKSQPFFVWGRPGELALVSNSNSPGTQLHRHPYFECSLFPDVDVDVLAGGGANASADQVIDLPSAYSVLPLASSRSGGGGGGGVTTSTNSLNEQPLSTRAHFSFISYRNHQDEKEEEEDGSGSNRHPNPLVCVELICSEITFRADAAIVCGLTHFASSQSSFRKGERTQTYAYKKLPLPSSSPPPLTKSIAQPSIIARITMNGARLFLPRSTSAAATSVTFLQVECGLIRASLRQATKVSVDKLSSLVEKILLSADNSPSSLDSALVKLYVRSIVDSADSAVYPALSSPLFEESGSRKSLSECYSSLELSRFFVSELCTISKIELKAQGLKEEGGIEAGLHVESTSLTPSLNATLKWAEALASLMKEPFSLREAYIPLAPFTPLSILIDEVRLGVTRRTVDVAHVQCSVNQFDVAIGSDDHSLLITGGSSDSAKQVFTLSVEFAGLPPLISSLLSSNLLDPSNFTSTSSSTTLSDIQHVLGGRTAPGLFIGCSMGAISSDYENAQRFLDVCADIRVGAVALFGLAQGSFSSKAPIVMDADYSPNDRIVDDKNEDVNAISNSFRRWQNALMYAMPRNICLRTLSVHSASVILSRDISLVLPHILVDTISTGAERNSLLFSFSAETLELWHHIDNARGEEGSRVRKALLSRAEGRFLLRDNATGRFDVSLASSVRIDLDLLLLKSLLTIQPLRVPSALLASRSNVKRDSSPPFTLALAVAVPNFIVALNLCTSFDHHRSSSGIINHDNPPSSSVEVELTALSIATSDASISLKLGAVSVDHKIGKGDCTQILLGGRMIHKNSSSHQQSTSKEWLATVLTLSNSQTQPNEVNTLSNLVPTNRFIDIVLPERSLNVESNKLQCALGDTEIVITPALLSKILSWIETVSSLFSVPLSCIETTHAALRSVSLARSPALSVMAAPLLDLTTGNIAVTIEGNKNSNQNISVKSYGLIVRLQHSHSPSSDSVQLVENCRRLSLLSTGVSIQSSDKVLVGPTDLSLSVLAHATQDVSDFSLSSTLAIETNLPEISVSVSIAELLSMVAIGSSFQDAISYELSAASMARSSSYLSNNLADSSIIAPIPKSTSGYVLESSLTLRLSLNSARFNLLRHSNELSSSSGLISLLVLNSNVSVSQSTSVSMSELEESRGVCISLSGATKSLSASCGGFQARYGASETQILEISPSTSDNLIFSLSSTSSLERLSRRMIESIGSIPDALIVNLVAQVQPITVTLTPAFIASLVRELSTIPASTLPHQSLAVVAWHHRLLEQTRSAGGVQIIDTSSFITVMRLRLTSSLSVRLQSQRNDSISLHLAVGPILLSSSLASLPNVSAEKIVKLALHRKGLFALDDTALLQSTVTLSEASVSLVKSTRVFTLLEPVTAQASVFSRSFFLPLCETSQKAASPAIASIAMSHSFASVTIGGSLNFLLDAQRIGLLLSIGIELNNEMTSSTTTSFDSSSQTQSRPFSTVLATPLLTLLPRGLSALDLPHSLSQLPVSVSRSLANDSSTSFSLGASSFPPDALLLSGIGSSSAQSDLAGTSIQVSDTALWVPNSLWERSVTLSSVDRFNRVTSSLQHIGQGTNTDNLRNEDSSSSPFDIHRDWKLTRGRTGAWWGSFSWNYAFPVHLKDVSSSAPVPIPQHTFVESLGGDKRYSSCAEVPATLCCVLDRLERSPSSMSSMNAPCLTTPAEIFVHGWVPVCSFQLSTASSNPAGSESTPFTSNLPLIGLMWHDSPPSTRTVNNTSPNTISDLETFCNSSSSTWRIRWLEPLLTASSTQTNSARGDVSNQKFSHPPYVVVGSAIASVLRLCASWSTSKGTKDPEEEDEKKKRRRKNEEEEVRLVATIPKVSSLVQTPGLRFFVSEKAYFDDDASVSLGIAFLSPSLDVHFGLTVCARQEYVGSFSTSAALTECIAFDVNTGGASQLASRFVLLPDVGVDVASIGSSATRARITAGACSVNLLPQTISSLLDLGSDLYAACARPLDDEHQVRPVEEEKGMFFENLTDLDLVVCQGGIESAGTLIVKKRSTSTWVWPSSDAMLPLLQGGDEDSGITGVRCFRISSTHSPLTWSEPVPVDESLTLKRSDVFENNININNSDDDDDEKQLTAISPFRASFPRFVWAERVLQTQVSPSSSIESSDSSSATTLCLPVLAIVTDPSQSSSESRVTLRGAVSLCNRLGSKIVIKWKQVLRSEDIGSGLVVNVNDGTMTSRDGQIDEMDNYEEIKSTKEEPKSSTLLGAIGSYFFGDSDSSRTNDIDKSLSDTDDTSEKIIARTIAPVVEISGSIVLEPGESADVSCVAPGPDSSFFLQISSAASPTSSSSLPQQVDVSSELFALPECNTLVSLRLAGMLNDHDAIANDDCNSSPPFTMTALLQVRKEQLRASYLSLSDASSLPPDITVVSIYPWLSVDTNGVTKDIELCSGDFSTPLQTSAVTTPLLLSPKCLPLEHLSLYQGDRNTTSSLSSSISTPKSTPSSPSVAVLTCLVALAKALSEAERRDQINVNNASSRPPPPPSASSSVSSTVSPTVSVALALDAPIKPLLLDSSIQSSFTEVSIEASRAWHLIPIHTIYGGGSSQASLCRTSWHNSTGATLSMRAPLEIINSLDESIDISFALPGDASTNAGGLSTHGFFASVSPGQVLQIFDVPLIATGADGSSCIEAAIALTNPRKCKSLQQNNATNSAYYTSSSLSSKHHVSSKDKLRSTQFLLPLSVNSTAMPLVLAGDGEWCVPLIVKADSSSSSSSTPSLRWTISPRFVIHSQTKSTLSWSHPNLSRLMDAPATVSGVIHSFTTTQCSTLCVPTVSAMNMIDEPVTAINLSLAGSSLGVICIRLGDPQHENHSKKRSYSTLPTSGSSSSSSSSSSSPSSLQTHSSSVNNFGRDFQSLRSLLTCPSIPAGYSVRIPLLSGNNRSLQGLLLVRVLLDDLTGATNVIVLDDPQPPVRFVNSSTSSAAVAIRLARAPRLLPEHRLAFQLALCSPLEAVEVLGRMAQEEESLIRARLLEAADKSSEGSINTNNSSTNGGSGGSSVHGSNNNNSGGVASDLISYGSELALAHAKVALEQVSNEVDEWARAAKNNAPAVLTEHLMWSSQFDVDPSYSVVVGVNESAPFDWSLMVDIGLRTAFSERPFLIPWTPAIPLVWSSSQQQVFMQRPTSSSASHQTPQIDLEDVSAPQKDGGAKFRLTSSVWRRACANASMIPARVFEGDSPIQHILPNIQIQSLGGVGVQPFVNTDLVLRSSLHSQSSPLASQSSNTTSSTFACDLLDGTLTVYLHDDIGGLIEKGETELETKPSSSFSSSSSSSISSTNDKTESNLYSMRVDRISVALLSPEAVPVEIPSSSPLSPENYSWWVPIVPKGTFSSSSPTGVLLPPRFTSSNLAKRSLSSSSSSSCVANPPYALTRHRQLLVLHVFGTSAAVSTSSFPQMACSTSSSLFLGFEHAQLDDHQIPSPSGLSSSENRANDVGSPLRFTVIAMLSPQEDGGIFEQNYALSACIEAVSLPSLGGSFASSGGARGGGLGLSNVSVSLGLLRLQLSDTAADEIIEAYKIWAPLLISKIEVLKEALLTTSIIKTDDTLSDTLSGSEKEKQISRSITFLLPLTMLTLGQLRIAKIAIEVSLCASKPGSGPLFIAVDRMPLAFSAITLKNVISTPEALLRAIVASYIVDTLLRSPALVGSLDLLGNPTNLSRSIAAGLYDVFALPLRGRGGRPGGGRGSVIDVLTGIGLGWASLAGHITEGTLHSIAGLSVSLSRNINRLLSQHHHQHQQHHQQLNHNHPSERIGGLNGGSPRRFVDTGRGGREGGEGVQSPGGKIVNQTSMLSTAPVSLPRLHAHSDASASPPSSPTRLTAQTSTGMDPNLQEESSAPSLAVISNTTSSSLSQTKDNALLQRSLSWYSPRPLQSNDDEENQLPLFLCNDDSKVGGIAYLNMNANGASSSFSSFILEGGSKNNNSRVSLLRSVIMRGSMSSSSYSSSSSSSFSSSSSLSSTLVSSTTDSSALVAGIRPSLADGIEGLGRGLLGAVSDLASLSMQAMSSEPSRGTGSVIAEVGRGLASAITKPVAGALELIAHASTAAMLAVQFTPRVAHVSPVEWSQMAMVSPPTPVFLKALSLLGKYKHEEEKDHALIFIPCNVRRVRQQGANHVEQRGSTATVTNASSSSSSSNERAWLIGNAQSHHHQRFVFIRHGGRGSRAFQAINVGQGKRLPDVLSALSNVVSVKEVGNSALLKSAQKGDSISTTTVSFLITLQEEEKEGKKDTTAPVVVNSSSSSSSISSSLPTSMSPASKLLPSTPVKTSKASSMEAPGSTPINVRSPQNGSTTPSSTTTSSGFNLNFFSSSSPSLAPLSPLSSAANPLAQSKARDKFDVLVILPVDLLYLFSKIILCNKN